jgi:hypothetical protein
MEAEVTLGANIDEDSDESHVDVVKTLMADAKAAVMGSFKTNTPPAAIQGATKAESAAKETPSKTTKAAEPAKVADVPDDVPGDKPVKRKRRTKAEMEAAKLREAERIAAKNSGKASNILDDVPDDVPDDSPPAKPTVRPSAARVVDDIPDDVPDDSPAAPVVDEAFTILDLQDLVQTLVQGKKLETADVKDIIGALGAARLKEVPADKIEFVRETLLAKAGV